jgi:hypothetical protein
MVAGRAAKRAARPGLDPHGTRRLLTLGVGSLALVGLGVVIGSWTASGDPARPAAMTVTVRAPSAPTQALRPAPLPRDRAAGSPRTESGAVAAATEFIGVLDGRSLLDGPRLRALIRAAAAPSISDRLLAAYGQASAEARRRLGLGTVPAPVVIIRGASVGYRVETFSPDAATVSVWRVGIIGSGASVQPEQSWRTETVSVVWSAGGWKIGALASRPGPTPPLAARFISTPVELFASVPRFEEFTHVDP